VICEYGCNNEARYFFKSGKWCCNKSHNSCEGMKRKNSKLNKGRNISRKTRQKMSESAKGKIAWNKGKKGFLIHSEKTKQIISDIHKGKKLSEEQKEKIRMGNKGKIISKETKKLMSENHADFSGKNHPNWKGGTSIEPYCEIWGDKKYKNSIKERDGNVCLNPYCSGITEDLRVHHIDYNKKNCHPLNLITVCISCNSKANKDREWHNLWYKTIIFRRGYHNVKYK